MRSWSAYLLLVSVSLWSFTLHANERCEMAIGSYITAIDELAGGYIHLEKQFTSGPRSTAYIVTERALGEKKKQIIAAVGVEAFTKAYQASITAQSTAVRTQLVDHQINRKKALDSERDLTFSLNMLTNVNKAPLGVRLALSANGEMFVTSSRNGPVRIMKSDTGEVLYELPKQESFHRPVFSPDGRYLAYVGQAEYELNRPYLWAKTATIDRIYIFDLQNGREHSQYDFKEFSSLGGFAFSADSQHLLMPAALGEYVIDLSKKEMKKISNFGSNEVKLSDDGQLAFFSANKKISLIDISTGALIKRFKREHRSFEFLLTSDNRYLIHFCGFYFTKLCISDLKTGDVKKLDISPSPKLSMTVSPDGKNLIVGDVMGGPRIFDISTGLLVSQLAQPNQEIIYVVKYSPDGKYILGHTERFAVIWSSKTGEVLGSQAVKGTQLTWHLPVSGVFSADNSLLTTQGSDGSIVTWDLGRKAQDE